MKSAILTCALLSLSGGSLALAQPTIRAGSILNAASRLVPGFPNYGIAQGSMFIVRGRGLGASTPPFTTAGFPLPMTLAGASMQIAVGGATVNVPMVYAAVGMFQDYNGPYDELAGIAPSTTPTGAGTLTVTYNGKTSAPSPITIVTSAFGIFTLNQSGLGPGVFTSANFTLNSLTDATHLLGSFSPDTTYTGNTLIAPAHPGDQLVIWGTGLGPISGDDTAAPLSGNLNVPVTVYVGNGQANVTSQGRVSCCSGIDNIQITVPAGVEGCYVPVAVRIGAIVSNFTTVSISDGSVCSDPNGWPASALQNGAPRNIASIELDRLIANFSFPGVGTVQGTLDLGDARFERPFGPPLGFLASIGSALGSGNTDVPSAGCFVFPFLTDGYVTDGTLLDNFLPGPDALPVFHSTIQYVDAGPALNVTGPGGPMPMSKIVDPNAGAFGSYKATFGGGAPPLLAPTPLYLAPGSYTVDNGAGGNDIGAFTATLTIPGNPASWTGQDAFTNIDRTQDLTVTWTGSGLVEITGSSENPATGVGAQFSCIAGDANNGTFTVPAWVLSALPASGLATDIPAPVGFLGLATGGGIPFEAPGIDVGYINWAQIQIKNVNYQ